MLAVVDTLNETSLYTTEHGFSAAKFEETVWERLLPGEAEGYRYHLAFELARVPGIRTGYVAIKRGGIVVFLAPYFIQEYVRDSLAEDWSTSLPACLEEGAQEKTRLRLLSVGSPVTHGCKLGIAGDYQFDPDMVDTLCAELMRIGRRMQIDAILFRELMRPDAHRLALPLQRLGFVESEGARYNTWNIGFANMDACLASLSDPVRDELQQQRAQLSTLDIREYAGMPDMEAIHAMQAASGLTSRFFESVAALMPQHCRYVFYRSAGRLLAFNLLLHRDGVLTDQYVGVDPSLDREIGLREQIWLHNMQMCVRDGFHTYRSGDPDSRLAQLGAQSQQTYHFFRWMQAADLAT